MGLNIFDNNTVGYDDSHHRRVNTSLKTNPTQNKLGNIVIRHVFRRNKIGDKDRDGNPLIYALKEMNGYRIDDNERTKFFVRAAEIIETFAGNLQADFVMPLPSSKSFCADFGRLVCDVTGIEYLAPDFLTKKSIQQALDQYGHQVPDALNPYSSRKYKSQLKTWRKMSGHEALSMKEVDQSIRRCFNPLIIDNMAPELEGCRILLVDDLMSSGASLLSASSLLKSKECIIDQGVCFLSGL